QPELADRREHYSRDAGLEDADPAQSQSGWLHHLKPAGRAAQDRRDRGTFRAADVPAFTLWTGLRHITDAGCLPADTAADEHDVRLPSRARSTNPTRRQHPVVPDEQQICSPGCAGWHDRLSIQSGPAGIRRDHLADQYRAALAGV